MIELVKKSMMSGLGLALMAKDEAESLAQEWIKQGKMTEEEGKRFLEELLARYGETQQKMEERVGKTVKDILKRADIVTGDELKSLKKEIRDLKKAISAGKEEA